MDVKKLLTIGVAVGVVVNVIDFIVQGNLMAGWYASNPVFRNVETEGLIPWLVAGDFVAAFVFAWFYLTLGRGYSGMAGGARFGAMAGVFASFPVFHFMYLMVAGLPYSMSWFATVYGVVWYVVAGAVAGALNKS